MDPGAQAPQYSAVVLAAGSGRTVLPSVAVLPPAPGALIHLRLPRKTLGSGAFVLVLRAHEQGRMRELDRYPFVVESPRP